MNRTSRWTLAVAAFALQDLLQADDVGVELAQHGGDPRRIVAAVDADAGVDVVGRDDEARPRPVDRRRRPAPQAPPGGRALALGDGQHATAPSGRRDAAGPVTLRGDGSLIMQLPEMAEPPRRFNGLDHARSATAAARVGASRSGEGIAIRPTASGREDGSLGGTPSRRRRQPRPALDQRGSGGQRLTPLPAERRRCRYGVCSGERLPSFEMSRRISAWRCGSRIP